MKAVVPGATGFLGAHVMRLLAERGDEVKVTYRIELIEIGTFHDEARSGMSTIAGALGQAAAFGLLHPVRIGRRMTRRRVVVGI